MTRWARQKRRGFAGTVLSGGYTPGGGGGDPPVVATGGAAGVAAVPLDVKTTTFGEAPVGGFVIVTVLPAGTTTTCCPGAVLAAAVACPGTARITAHGSKKLPAAAPQARALMLRLLIRAFLAGARVGSRSASIALTPARRSVAERWSSERRAPASARRSARGTALAA